MAQDYAELIQRIREGDQKALHELYLQYRVSFIEWAMARFRCNREDALDTYQEVMVVFYENIQEGKIERLRSHIRTYLFGIGKILLLNRFRKQSRFADWEAKQADISELQELNIAEAKLELSERQQLIRTALGEMGEKCRELLQLFYYRRCSNEVIMQRMGYGNTDVVKSQKARCMKRLRAWMAERVESRDEI